MNLESWKFVNLLFKEFTIIRDEWLESLLIFLRALLSRVPILSYRHRHPDRCAIVVSALYSLLLSSRKLPSSLIHKNFLKMEQQRTGYSDQSLFPRAPFSSLLANIEVVSIRIGKNPWLAKKFITRGLIGEKIFFTRTYIFLYIRWMRNNLNFSSSSSFSTKDRL